MKVLSFFLALTTANQSGDDKRVKPIHHPDHPRNSVFAHNSITSSRTGLPFSGKFSNYDFSKWRPYWYRTDRSSPFQPDAAFMQRMRSSRISFDDTMSLLENRVRNRDLFFFTQNRKFRSRVRRKVNFHFSFFS